MLLRIYSTRISLFTLAIVIATDRRHANALILESILRSTRFATIPAGRRGFRAHFTGLGYVDDTEPGCYLVTL